MTDYKNNFLKILKFIFIYYYVCNLNVHNLTSESVF
jgi:hypothetical protein